MHRLSTSSVLIAVLLLNVGCNKGEKSAENDGKTPEAAASAAAPAAPAAVPKPAGKDWATVPTKPASGATGGGLKYTFDVPEGLVVDSVLTGYWSLDTKDTKEQILAPQISISDIDGAAEIANALTHAPLPGGEKVLSQKEEEDLFVFVHAPEKEAFPSVSVTAIRKGAKHKVLQCRGTIRLSEGRSLDEHAAALLKICKSVKPAS